VIGTCRSPCGPLTFRTSRLAAAPGRAAKTVVGRDELTPESNFGSDQLCGHPSGAGVTDTTATPPRAALDKAAVADRTGDRRGDLHRSGRRSATVGWPVIRRRRPTPGRPGPHRIVSGTAGEPCTVQPPTTRRVGVHRRAPREPGIRAYIFHDFLWYTKRITSTSTGSAKPFQRRPRDEEGCQMSGGTAV